MVLCFGGKPLRVARFLIRLKRKSHLSHYVRLSHFQSKGLKRTMNDISRRLSDISRPFQPFEPFLSGLGMYRGPKIVTALSHRLLKWTAESTKSRRLLASWQHEKRLQAFGTSMDQTVQWLKGRLRLSTCESTLSDAPHDCASMGQSSPDAKRRDFTTIRISTPYPTLQRGAFSFVS